MSKMMRLAAPIALALSLAPALRGLLGGGAKAAADAADPDPAGAGAGKRRSHRRRRAKR